MLTSEETHLLKQLYHRLMKAGCNMFQIKNIGGPQVDNVDWLGKEGEEWEVYYMERGIKYPSSFKSRNLEDAIDNFEKQILSIEHIHLVVMTRSLEKFEFYKNRVEAHQIKTKQNDIPHYKFLNDKAYRLFVMNADIFKVREFLPDVPIFDDDFK